MRLVSLGSWFCSFLFSWGTIHKHKVYSLNYFKVYYSFSVVKMVFNHHHHLISVQLYHFISIKQSISIPFPWQKLICFLFLLIACSWHFMFNIIKEKCLSVSEIFLLSLRFTHSISWIHHLLLWLINIFLWLLSMLLIYS